jgi:DNA-binding NtrC family response regulator
MPDWSDLRSRIRFSPADGRIWLDDQRMMLIHLEAMKALRRELIDSLGTDRARGILTRMGYVAGTLDAKLARRVRPDASYFDILAVGPQLHALEGVVAVDPVSVEVDVARGIHNAEFLWRDSSEVDAHVSSYGTSAEPVCWMQIGYACGYTSAFMGKPILYREVQCRAMGHPACRIIGKPAEDWGKDAEADLRYLRADGVAYPEPIAAKMPPQRAPFLDPMVVDQLVGVSSGFVATCQMLQKVASTNATVLYLGETGVGKEMFARTLHRISKRAEQPFIAINCAAIPENLVEAELFGVEKGAFTGAISSRPGRFERANGGTLFLDEVGSLPLAAQGKLLRALQEREIERVGDIRSRKVDVRVVAATNVDLQTEVKAGRFREDLMFRLNVFPVRIPPLRERRDDIPVLMAHFLKRFTAQHGRHITGFTERAVDALLQYRYPGNIRELENMIERAVILASDTSAICVAHLFSSDNTFLSQFLGIDGQGRFGDGEDGDGEDTPCQASLSDLVGRMLESGTPFETLETTLITEAVAKSDGNLSKAARLLGMTRPQLAYRYAKITGEDE